HAQLDLGRVIPLKPVYRLLKGHRRVAETPEARRRPVGVPQVLWLADTMHWSHVYGPHRKKRKAYLIAILDDASRAIMAGQFALADDVAALIPVLRQALLARGCPSRLLVDNGPNYRSRVMRTACATLGVQLVYATPYRATAKARLERFFLTVRLQLPPMLPPFPTLEDLRAAWARLLAAYHAEPHRTLTELVGKPTSPLDYYLTHLPPDVRQVSEVSLDRLLQVEETRRVNPDGTIRVAAKFFEVRSPLTGHVRVRFNPAHPVKVFYRPLKEPEASFEEAFPIE
ncbi:MAG: transposase family protein, partial [Betaproteobacteria bacterium]|nr:transposase family protein [Betaproteobacteria bacterium]